MAEGDALLYVGGSKIAFRCECGANVFRKISEKPRRYRCNGCGQTYTAGVDEVRKGKGVTMEFKAEVVFLISVEGLDPESAERVRADNRAAMRKGVEGQPCVYAGWTDPIDRSALPGWYSAAHAAAVRALPADYGMSSVEVYVNRAANFRIRYLGAGRQPAAAMIRVREAQP
jgi:hypothetical protein